jgi:hypothetical protein
MSHKCQGLKKDGLQCDYRGKYINNGKRYCGIHRQTNDIQIIETDEEIARRLDIEWNSNIPETPTSLVPLYKITFQKITFLKLTTEKHFYMRN